MIGMMKASPLPYQLARHGIRAAALLLCGCAMMTMSGYEYLTTSLFGDRVEITPAEKDTLAANLDKAAWLARSDRFAWISTDSLVARFQGKLDTGRLGMWVVADSAVYYGKVGTDGGFTGAYVFDFRIGAVFFQDLAGKRLPPGIAHLALAQFKAVSVFEEYREKHYSGLTVYSRVDGDRIEVFLIPANSDTYDYVGGGLYSRWDLNARGYTGLVHLHPRTWRIKRSDKEGMLDWYSESGSVPNAVDLFQVLQLRNTDRIQFIHTGKYIFAHKSRDKDMKFDVFGKEFFEKKMQERKKK
jgi:hypothetical protein